MAHLAVLLCMDHEERYLVARSVDRLADAWDIARGGKWKSRQLVLVVTKHHPDAQVTYVGLADRGDWKGTHQGDLVVTGLTRVDGPVRVAEIKAALPEYAARYFDQQGEVKPKSGDVILAALFALRPSLREVVARLLEPRQPIEVRGPVGHLVRQVRDACGLAMQMTGLPRDPLESWRVPDDLSRQSGSFLSSLPPTRAQERDLLKWDQERFPGWFGVDSHDVVWRQYGKGHQRLLICDVDTKRDEIAMGVDLIYYHEDRRSFILVQYKAMEADGSDWAYRPSDDRHITKQVERMRVVDENCLATGQQGDDYRLTAAPCWVKLCRSGSTIPRTDELIRGMYLTRAYFERLKDDPQTPCRGPKGGVMFSYATVPRYLDNTTFAQLVADGWIGSTGTGTELIGEQVHASREGNQQPIVAVASGDTPKGHRTKERMSGR